VAQPLQGLSQPRKKQFNRFPQIVCRRKKVKIV